MTSPIQLTRRRSVWAPEPLDPRIQLSAVPYGASASDTAEFMLGDVAVTVVLLESNGSIDPNLEDWQPSQIESVKNNVMEGLKWWEERLDDQNSVHSLNFVTDFTYANQPIDTGYEPIGRESDDFELWIEDFFAAAGIGGSGSFSDRIRVFNHHQRLRHNTNWAFTIFIVNAQQDADQSFETSGSFSLSFGFPGGEFFVTTSERPASSIAHETAHMFWAMDEYPGSKTYLNHRGYYDTQNLNAYDGHPDPTTRVRSIMDSASVGYALKAVSPSALESIGWRDSDGDGIFDVLDVAHTLQGSGAYDPILRRLEFEGVARVATLPNLNRSGNGNAITLNQIDRIEVRFDGASWQTVVEPHEYEVELELAVDIPAGVRSVELRAVDEQSHVTSDVWFYQIETESPVWQNVNNPLDVNQDLFVSPLDALLVVNLLNSTGPRELMITDVGLPLVDVTGDGFLSPIDALQVINALNVAAQPVSTQQVVDQATAEGEMDRSASRLDVAAQCGFQPAMVHQVLGRRNKRAPAPQPDPQLTSVRVWKPARSFAAKASFDQSEPVAFARRTAVIPPQVVDAVLCDLMDSAGHVWVDLNG